MDAARTPEQRKADTLTLLGKDMLDAWVASASSDAVAHLVPLSLAWDDVHLIIATEATAVTTRNIVDTERARIGLGGTRDVVLIDAVLERSIDAADAPVAVAEAYVSQAGWDPRASDADFVIHLLHPVRIQAWREANEIAGRTLMQDGHWIVD